RDFPVCFGIAMENELRHAITIAQMDEQDAAQVAAAVHPPHQNRLFTGIGRTQFSAGVRAPQFAEKVQRYVFHGFTQGFYSRSPIVEYGQPVLRALEKLARLMSSPSISRYRRRSHRLLKSERSARLSCLRSPARASISGPPTARPRFRQREVRPPAY